MEKYIVIPIFRNYEKHLPQRVCLACFESNNKIIVHKLSQTLTLMTNNRAIFGILFYTFF